MQRYASRVLSWLHVGRAVATVCVLVCLAMLYSIAPRLTSGSASFVALDEFGTRVAALPSLPLASSSLGTWRLGDDAVGWLRFTDDDTRPIEELPAHGDDDTTTTTTPAPCKHDTHDDNDTGTSPLCVLWRARTTHDRPRDTPTDGVVAVSPLLDLSATPATLLLRLFVQPSRALVEDSVAILCHGTAPWPPPPPSLSSWHSNNNSNNNNNNNNDNDNKNTKATAAGARAGNAATAAAFTRSDGRRVWYAFGHSMGQSRQLRSLFPATALYANALVDKYLNGTLEQREAMQLFARVYAHQQAMRERDHNASSSSSSSHDKVRGAASTSSSVVASHAAPFAPTCYWLCELSLGDDGAAAADTHKTHKGGNNNNNRADADTATATSDVVSRAWSTCGDRVSHTTSRRAYDDFVARVNVVALLLLVALALPFVVGLSSQYAWMRNSRGRTLRVSLAQVLVVLFWLSFDLGVLSMLWMRAAHARKTLALLFAINFVAVVTLSLLAFMIDVERMRYTEGREEASSSVRCLFLLYIVSWVGTSAVELLQRQVTNAWVVGVAAGSFWLPQLWHSVVMGSWNGLTVPFLCGSALLALLPMCLTALLPVSPWTVSSRERVVLCAGAAAVALQTALLVLFDVTHGRHLLPSWLVPWRHVYRTTCEAQRATLQENVMCPICRSTLLEGWSADDALWQTPCHHLFHKSCLERWMSERMECPLCRTLLPEP